MPLGVVGGLLLGIGAYRWRWLERALLPVLDLMQTIPVFAYLVPILFLFGFGATAAVVATLIYAMPPMTRVTMLALRQVPPDVRDLGNMIGCTRHQMTWRVLVPSAKDSLLVGMNQVIMLSLNMVIIASMIGAGGLGFDVLAALRRLEDGLTRIDEPILLRLEQMLPQAEASVAWPHRSTSAAGVNQRMA